MPNWLNMLDGARFTMPSWLTVETQQIGRGRMHDLNGLNGRP